MGYYDKAENTHTRASGSVPSKVLPRVDGLYVSGLRYYSPQIGRWISRDPIGERGGRNVYAFIRNDPTSYYDYLGLSSNPEMLMAVIRKLSDCKKSNPNCANWDSGIDFLMSRAYNSTDWLTTARKSMQDAKSRLDALTAIPDKVQSLEDLKDWLDNAYAGGTMPKALEKALSAYKSASSEINFDKLSGELKAIGNLKKLLSAEKLAVLFQGDKDLSPGELADGLADVFDFATGVGGKAPVVGDLLEFYSEALKEIAKAIHQISNDKFDQVAPMILDSSCSDIGQGGTGAEVGDLLKLMKKLQR